MSKPTKNKKKSVRRKTSKAIAIDARRRNIFGMLLQGHGPAHIMEAYKLTRNVYDKDTTWIREQMQTEIKLPDLEESKAILFERSKQRISGLWEEIMGSTEGRHRLRAYDMLRKEDIHLKKLLQAIGILPTEHVTNFFAAQEMHVVQNQNETKEIHFHWGDPPVEQVEGEKK
ncbi:hypothetical protein IIA15_00995 [candidate division TA06 bacterium]|nr:hypothetical protein [candidate division TA06 bacterium]